MEPVFLSNTELYYGTVDVESSALVISTEEFHHLSRVMRHRTGDEIFVTDGNGSIYSTVLSETDKDRAIVEIKERISYDNPLRNITFCICRLKNPDRFEFALEKLTELGITDIIVYDSENTVSKTDKKERWEKLILSAMKQSLRSYLPDIKYRSSIDDIISLNGNHIIFEQNAEEKLTSFVFNKSDHYYLIFGPEGGLTDKEIGKVKKEHQLRLTNNRLRSETAIVSVASYLSLGI
ncbi:MAG: RsmE family RNA methyltransferase [Bacteroidota bacterium]